ncbi:unnamed protein product [Rhizophagus irregularis]|nr:unnamed protein product [Rhizophagus irregularis]
MVNRVTCSADKISRLTNPQIDYIIEQVKSKTITSPVNEIPSTVATTSAHDSSSDDSDADSDANKSDSDVYFKSDDSDSDDEYDHELHERLQREEMERLAKLEEKTQSKPEVYDDDFNKILMEIHENDDIYFDDDGDPVPQLVMKSPIIAPVSA